MKYNGKFEKICFFRNEVVVRILRHGSSIKRHFAGLIFQTKNIVLEQEFFFFSRLMAKYPFRNYFISRKRQKTSFKNRRFVHCVERLKCPTCTFRSFFFLLKEGGDRLATIRCSSPLEESYRIIYLP